MVDLIHVCLYIFLCSNIFDLTSILLPVTRVLLLLDMLHFGIKFFIVIEEINLIVFIDKSVLVDNILYYVIKVTVIYRLRASKTEPAPGSLLLAVCPRGLKVCPENNPPSIFLWSSIGKLSFERKKFEIRTSHEKLTLYTSSDEKSRLLLALCKAAHQFSMAVAPRLNEVRREEEERQRWDCDQRISVISSTSSNTTSGIVSDRVHSEDELEIMITSPPAPSTESLALAHLLDSAPASSRTSAASATAALATLTLKEEDEVKPTLSESSAKTNSGKFTGSQCSSSCSTVVVTPIQTSEFSNYRFLIMLVVSNVVYPVKR